MFVLGVYGGYFGAGVGIILLAALALERTEPLAVTNAVKNVATGVATARPRSPTSSSRRSTGRGARPRRRRLVGGLLGPSIVRVAPETPLRWLVGTAGLVLALALALG